MRRSRGIKIFHGAGFRVPAYKFHLAFVILLFSLLPVEIRAEEINDPELTNAIAFARSRLRATQPKLVGEELQRLAEATGRSNYLHQKIGEAYGRGDTDQSAVLLKQFPGNVNDLQVYGEPMLVRVVRQSDVEFLKLLIERKVDVNRGGWDQEPPLSVAIQDGRWPVAKALVEAGASLTITNREGATPLGVLVNNWEAGRQVSDAKIELLEKMLSRDADPYVAQRNGTTRSILEQALMSSDWEAGDLLLTNKASVARRTPDGDTALHLATYWGKTNAIIFLLNAGFNINQTNDHGLTPLQVLAGLIQREAPSNSRYGTVPMSMAIRNTAPDNIKLLLERGAKLDIWSAAGLGKTNELAAMLAAEPSLANARDGVGRTPLHYAAFIGNIEAAAKLIAAGADPKAETSRQIWRLPPENPLPAKATPLHLASIRGKAAMAELLLKAGAKPGAFDSAGNTPLHMAERNYDTNVMGLLIRFGAPKDALNVEGNTALRLAIESGNTSAAGLLLKSGARPTVGVRDSSLLHIAATRGHTASIELLLRHGLKVDVRDKEGNTPFMVAVNANQWAIMQLLVKKGADVNAVDLKGNSALHQRAKFYQDMISHQVEQTWLDKLELEWMSRQGFRRNVMTNLVGRNWLSPPTGMRWTNSSMTGWLLEKGAKPDLKNVDGNTPLHLFASASQLRYSGQFSALQITNLLKGGAKIDSRNKAGLTPLHIAVTNAPPVFVAALIFNGLRIDDLKDASGRTPLHVAVTGRDHYATTNTALLLSKGANPNARDLAGMTPLHVAVTNYNAQADQVVMVLLQNKANPNARDNLGKTPLHLAFEAGGNNPSFYQSPQLMEALAKAGADASLLDNEGATVLHRWAAQGRRYSGSFDMMARKLLGSNPQLVNLTNKVGDTALHIAVRSNDYSRVMVLRNANPDLTMKNMQGETPLYLACVRSMYGLDQQLRPKGASMGFFMALTSHEKRSIDAWLEAEPNLARATNMQGQSALMAATQRPPYDIAKKLLGMGAQMDLLSALRMDDTESVKELLRGATNISKDILFEGIRLKRFELLKEAAQKYGDLRTVDWEGHTLLYRALSKDQEETANWLKEQGVKTLFLDAVALGDTNQLAAELAANRSLANGTSALGHTMLMVATKARKVESVKMLIAHGALVNEAIERGWTALHVAPSWDAGEVAEELLKAGANPNMFDSNGLTPLHLAAINGATNVLKLLLEHGVKVNQPQGVSDEESSSTMSKGATALHWAANRGRLAVIKMLLANGAEVNATNVAGETPLDLVRSDYQVPSYYYMLPNGMSMNPYPAGQHKELKEIETVMQQAGGVRKKRQ